MPIRLAGDAGRFRRLDILVRRTVAKVVFPLVLQIPEKTPVRLIFMQRELSEILLSQRNMLPAMPVFVERDGRCCRFHR